MDELRFSVSPRDPNTLVYQGIKAGGKVGIPKEITSKIIPGMSIGGYAEVEYDSFNNNCIFMSTSFDFFVVKADAVIRIKSVQVGNVMLAVPDTVVVSGGIEPGIPIIPVYTVAYLTRLGGGFDGLYDTVTGNFAILPPITLKAIAGVSIAKIFTADKVTLEVSLRGLGIISEKMKIANIDILKEVSLRFSLEDTWMDGRVKFDFRGTSKIDISGVIVGDSLLYIGVDSAKKGILGPASLGGSVNGAVQIPQQIPFTGGIRVGSAHAGISDENVYAKITVIGIPVGIKYVWGSSAPIMLMSLGMRNGQDQYLGTISDNNGAMVFGDNIRVREISGINKLGRVKLMSAGGSNNYMYNFDVAKGQQYELIEANYEGAVPKLTLTDPAGSPVELIEGTNYMVQTIEAADSESGNTEKRAFISLINPMEGKWTLRSDKQIGLRVMDVKSIPQLNTLTAAMENNKIKASWTGKDMGSAQISYYLCKNNTDDAGTLIAENIPNSPNQVVLDVPETINSGEYYLRAELSGDGKNYSGLYAAEKLNIIDPNQPVNPTSLTVKPAGDGLLEVNWEASADAEGYYLEVYDENGVSQGVIEINDGTVTNQVIGGRYNNSESGKAGGIIPGQTYEVALVAYKTVNNLLHLTPPLMSSRILVPVADPAEISVTPQAISGKVTEMVDNNGLAYYITNEASIDLKFTADQAVDTVVRVNDEDKLVVKGQEWQQPLELTEGENIIYVFSYNSSDDHTKTGFKVIRDTIPPELKIDYPQPGALVSGNSIDVKGFAELGSTVTVNGVPVVKDADNVFTASVDIGKDLNKEITVIARDQAFNETVYKTTVFNNNLKGIKRVIIKGQKSLMGTTEEQNLSLWAADNFGNEIRLNQDVVNWEILEGKQAASISDAGKLKALAEGNVIVRAAFAVTGDYQFEDAIVVKVSQQAQAEINSLQITPSDVSLHVGGEKQLEASLLYKDMTTESLSREAVQWGVVAGGEGIVSVNAQGLVKALKNGSAIVMAAYQSAGKTYEAKALVRVTGSSSSSDSTMSYGDQRILNILSNIKLNGEKTTIPTSVKAEMDTATGTASAKVAAGEMTFLADKAKETETAGQRAVVEINVEAPADAKAVKVEIPRAAFDKVADTTKADVKINAGLGTITFNAMAVDTISDAAAAGDISISIAKVDTSTLAKEMQNKIGDRPVFDFTVKAGTTEIADFGGGSAQISIPYTPKAGENKNAIVVYYIDSNGKLNPVRGKYDPASGTVNFTTGHFSKYAVGYNEVNFKDVADTAWYKEAVGFIAARGITTGTGNGSYGPDAKLTRGQFLVMMMRAYGINPDGNPADNFADAGSAYYTNYLAAAKRLGLAGGIGNNLFAPDKEITRQEMFTLLYRALKTLEELPTGTAGKPLADFSDAGQLAPWAKEAMALLAQTGTVSGSGGKLTPTATSTRAQMAQVLYNLLAK